MPERICATRKESMDKSYITGCGKGSVVRITPWPELGRECVWEELRTPKLWRSVVGRDSFGALAVVSSRSMLSAD